MGTRGAWPGAVRWRPLLLALAGLLIVALTWQIAAAFSTPSQFPDLGVVLVAAVEGWTKIPAVAYFSFQSLGIWDALIYTAVNVVVAVLAGSLLGIPMGVAMARLPRFSSLVDPPIAVVATVPLVILLPFITLWFGTARFAQSGLVIIYAFLTVTFATRHAAEVVGEHFANYASCLGASRARTLFGVILPAASPEVVGSVRLALASSWGWQVVAELLGGNAGLGRIIRATANLGAVAPLIASVLCLTVAAFIIDLVFVRVSRVFLQWQEEGTN
jgi:ABC-type nitrate/sulfonate/bicarbonate transport system permease component